MKTTLLRLSRRAACLVLAGGLLTSCSLLPAASPRHEGTASTQAPQYYSDAWLSDDSLHYVYSYAGNGGGTILRGGRVLYKASSSDSIQLLKDTLTGETGHYLVAHSTPGTEERTSTLYDADGNAVMTFPYAVSATLSGGLLILRDDADVWAFENGTTGELLTGEEDSAVSACGVGVACLQSRQDSRSVLYDLNSGEAVELGRFDWCVMDYTPGCVTLLGSDDPDNPYTLIDLASGEKTAVQRSDTDYHSGNVAVLTANNVLKIYDGTTGALLTDVEVTPVEEGHYVSLTALPDGYALLQYNSENYDTVAIQTYSGDGLLWSSAGEAQQYTYASYLTNTANGPLLTAHRDNSDSSNLSDVLDMEGNLLLRRLGSCYSIDDLPDDCFIARQGFDYGLMDSTGQWLYRESIFSSPSDDAGGGYLY